MPVKKKKKKKIKKSSATKSLKQLMIEDAGKGLENFNKVFRVNPYKEAVNIKNQKQLDRFLEE